MIRFGLFEADLHSAELRKNGRRVKIDGQPIRILGLLLERPGELVTREELQQKLWPADTFVDFEHSINAAVKRLRDALGESAESPRFIETLPRRGYRFIAPIDPVNRAPEGPPPGAPPPAVVSPSSVTGDVRASRTSWRFASRLAVFAVALPALLVATNVGGLRDWLFGPSIPSVAVLPVKDASNDPLRDDFAAGMTHLLIAELLRLGSIRVSSNYAVQQFRTTDASVAGIGRALNVQFVLETSVVRQADGTRFAAQLVNVAQETVLWSQVYDQELTNERSLQKLIAREVANNLRLVLTPEQQERLDRVQKVDPRAREAFFCGVASLWEGTTAGRGKAAERFDTATKIDPTFVEPYAYLALLGAHGGKYLVADEAATPQRARQWAAMALKDDEGSAEAHTALGWLNLGYWDWPGAEQEFQRAITANPNLPVAHTWYAQGLSMVGRHDDAIAQARLAIGLAPNDASVVTHAAIPYYEADRVQDADKLWRGVIAQHPDYWAAHNFLARADLLRGNYEEAIRELDLASSLRDPERMEVVDLALKVGAYARVGRRVDAQAIVDDLERRRAGVEDRQKAGKAVPFEERVPPIWLALAHLGIKEKERAIYWLELAYSHHGPDQVSGLFYILKSEPLYAPLRELPRFQELVTCVYDAAHSPASSTLCPPEGAAQGPTPRGK